MPVQAGIHDFPRLQQRKSRMADPATAMAGLLGRRVIVFRQLVVQQAISDANPVFAWIMGIGYQNRLIFNTHPLSDCVLRHRTSVFGRG